MRRKRTVIRTYTFEQVITLADCRHCGQPKGSACLNRKTKQSQEVPHPSRAIAASMCLERMEKGAKPDA